MMSQVNNLQRRESQRPINNNINNNRPRPTCYNCENTGHISRDCTRPRNRPFNRPNENNTPINNNTTPQNNIPLNNTVPLNNNTILQNSPPLNSTIPLNNNTPLNNHHNHNNHDQNNSSYFNLFDNQSFPYYPADRGGPSSIARKDPILTKSKDKGKSNEGLQPEYPQVIEEFQENPFQPELQTKDIIMNDTQPPKVEMKTVGKSTNPSKPRKALL